MSLRAALFAVLLIALGVLTYSAAVPAYAADTPAASAPTGNCKQYPGLTNRIASCVRATVDNVVGEYFQGFYQLVSRGVTAFVTLGVALFGVLAATGSIERVGRDTAFFLMKVAFITGLVTNVDEMYYRVTSLMDATGEAVVQYTPGAGTVDMAGSDLGSVSCLKNMHEAQDKTGEPPAGPWLGLDCLIDTVIGLKTENAGDAGGSVVGVKKYYNENLNPDNVRTSRGLIYLFFSAMKTSVVGAAFAIIGFMFIYGLIFMLVKALLVYLMAYIGIALLMIISPLFLPLLLLRVTKEYFDKWAKLVISFALQPVIIIVFIVFTIVAIDLAAFSSDYSLMYRIAGKASREKGFSLNAYLTQYKVPDENGGGYVDKPDDPKCTVGEEPKQCKAPISPAPKTVAQVKANTEKVDKGTCNEDEALVQGICESICTEKNIKNDPKIKTICGKGYPLQVWTDTVNWKELAERRDPAVVPEGANKDGTAVTPAQQIARECLSSVIFCGIVVFVMNGLLKVVPMVAYDLLGDFGQSPSLMKPISAFGSKSIGGGISQVTGRFKDTISSTLGIKR